jgi:hypothetical protein
MYTIDQLIEAQNKQMEANAKMAAANSEKAEADRRLSEIASYFAGITQFGIFYSAHKDYFLQKVSETSVQLIPKKTLPTESLPTAPPTAS